MQDKGVLRRVKTPADLKRFSDKELQMLASEVRDRIIEVVSQGGGHLASNLGTVELTVAIHAIFNAPVDQIVWDVGHQTYAHKILTGRNARFPSLRKRDGISGFPKRSESVYDAFVAGHSSTSVSAAYGIAKGRDLAGKDFHVVAVIGDGALTGGQAFEALNNAGSDKSRLIVVLNDNRMSIAPNVGALPGYLSRLRSDPAYCRLKEDAEHLLKRLPRIGDKLAESAERFKDRLKYLVVPGVLFEELGFTYLGPVDGHDIRALQQTLEQARKVQGPVLVHVLTVKGKGYPPAEEDPDRFHGPGPFVVETGEIVKKPGPESYTSVFGRHLVEMAGRNRKIVAITAAMPTGTGLTGFAKRFPDRFFDVGIAEQHAVTFAAGLATQGFRPVVAIYSTFLQRAYDQLIHDVCLQSLPVTIALDRGGIVGQDGETHQGIYDFAFLRPVPNLVVMAPKDEDELRSMLETALQHAGPAVVRYPRGGGVGVSTEGEAHSLEIGRAEVLAEGRDLAIVAIGSMVHPSLEAARILAAEGLQATVVNARFVKPLDGRMLETLARRHKHIITVEEHVLDGGFGSAVAEYLSDRGLLAGVNLRRLALPDEFIDHGDPGEILSTYGLDPHGIAAAAREVAGRPLAFREKKGI